MTKDEQTQQHSVEVAADTAGSRFDRFAWTLLRLTVGVVMTAHGWLKLVDPAGTQEQFASIGLPLPATMVWLAIAGEFLGGLGLFLGALTRVASFGVFCVMAVAIVTVHLGNGLMASNNGFEYPLVLLTAALAFIARGAGPFSVDALVRQRTKGSETRDPSKSSQGRYETPAFQAQR